MNIAIPTWQSRVSPVFDVARTFQVYSIEEGQTKVIQEIVLHVDSIEELTNALHQLEVELLICSSISRTALSSLQRRKIEVVPHVCGDVVEIVNSYLSGKLLIDARYAMPGCGRGKRFRWRGGRSRKRKQ